MEININYKIINTNYNINYTYHNFERETFVCNAEMQWKRPRFPIPDMLDNVLLNAIKIFLQR